MLRHAEIESLIYPLQDLQARVGLSVPAEYVDKEVINEAPDGASAYYSLTYYRRAGNDPKGKILNIEPILNQLVGDALAEYNVTWDVTSTPQGRNATTTTVTIQRGGESKKEATHVASVPYDVVPFTVYVDQDVYNLATDGNTFVLLKNGDVLVDDLPSPQYAFGTLVSYLREALDEVERTEGVESPTNDFIAGLAMTLVDTPEISDEAKEHFIQFYELTMRQDFEAAGEGQ